jgi:hypothetical protein
MRCRAYGPQALFPGGPALADWANACHFAGAGSSAYLTIAEFAAVPKWDATSLRLVVAGWGCGATKRSISQ